MKKKKKLSSLILEDGGFVEVKKGDTLWGIAQKYGVRWDDIAVANDIDDPRKLQIGAKLVIPGLEENITYQGGDLPTATLTAKRIDSKTYKGETLPETTVTAKRSTPKEPKKSVYASPVKNPEGLNRNSQSKVIRPTVGGSYRSGDVSIDELQQFRAKNPDVNTIVLLRGQNEGVPKAKLEEAGFKVEYLPIGNLSSEGEKKNFRKAVDRVKQGNSIVMCKHGYDRTGAVCAQAGLEAGMDMNQVIEHNYWSEGQSMYPDLPGKGAAYQPYMDILQQQKEYPVKKDDLRHYEDGGFIEYDGPSHEQGGIAIDKMGNPVSENNAIAEVEKQEVAIRSGNYGPLYVLSDNLINPMTGNTIAKDAKRMEKKMKGDDAISMAGRKLSRALLTKMNEEQRMRYGGNLKKMRNGGEPDNGEPNYEERLAQFRYLRDNPGATLPGVGPEDVPNIAETYGDQGPKGIYPNSNPHIPVIGPDFGKGMIEIKDVPALEDSSGNAAFPEALPSEEVINNLTGAITGGKVGGAMKVGAGILSMANALQKPEEEMLRIPDYSAGDRYYADMGIDPQALKNEILAQANASKAMAQEGSGSFGQFMNRVRAIGAETGRQLSTAELQAKQYNDQAKMMQGNREDMKAQTVAGEQIRKQTADSQNIAMRQDLIQNVLNQADAIGTEMMANDVLEKATAGMNENQRKQFVIDMAVMEAKYPDFKISEEVKLLLADPDATWEQIKEALSKDLVQFRGTNIGEIKAPADGN